MYKVLKLTKILKNINEVKEYIKEIEKTIILFLLIQR